MSPAMHPAAPHYLPGFITAPGESDPLMIASVILLIVLVMTLGSLYFWLHSIPERIAHGSGKVQFQLVAVLSLLALFTHNTTFWAGALFLALVPIPDFWTPLANMADSLGKMAARSRHPVVPETVAVIAPPPQVPPAVAEPVPVADSEVAEQPHPARERAQQGGTDD